LRPVRFVGNDNDVVALCVRILWFYVLIKFLHQGEDVSLVLS